MNRGTTKKPRRRARPRPATAGDPDPVVAAMRAALPTAPPRLRLWLSKLLDAAEKR